MRKRNSRAQAAARALAVAARLGIRRRQPDQLAAGDRWARRTRPSQLGYQLGGFASLETIVSLKPDLLLLSDGGDFAEDEGTAFLLHPALEQLYPPDKRIVIPERLTVCGGPMLADALTKLASANWSAWSIRC